MVLVVSSYETYLFLIKISQAKSEKKKLWIFFFLKLRHD